MQRLELHPRNQRRRRPVRQEEAPKKEAPEGRGAMAIALCADADVSEREEGRRTHNAREKESEREEHTASCTAWRAEKVKSKSER